MEFGKNTAEMHSQIVKLFSNIPKAIDVAIKSMIHYHSKPENAASFKVCIGRSIGMSSTFAYYRRGDPTDVVNLVFDGGMAGYLTKEEWLADKDEYYVSKKFSRETDRLPASDTIEELLDFYLSGNSASIQANKQLVLTCPHDMIFIPLTLEVIGDTYKYQLNGHQNGILISKKDGKVFRIEPSYNPEHETIDADVRINAGIINLVKAIGIENPVMIPINQICPQAITSDTNCIFWTLFICYEIILNSDSVNGPNEIITFYSSKPKEELQRIIKAFKLVLVTRLIPTFMRDTGDEFTELEKFNKDYPDYTGAKRHVKKTRKRKIRRRKSKKAKKSKRPF